MKEQLKRYVERVDNATLRERVLLFGAAALVLLYVVNALLIQPLRDTQRRLGLEVAEERAGAAHRADGVAAPGARTSGRS